MGSGRVDVVAARAELAVVRIGIVGVVVVAPVVEVLLRRGTGGGRGRDGVGDAEGGKDGADDVAIGDEGKDATAPAAGAREKVLGENAEEKRCQPAR